MRSLRRAIAGETVADTTSESVVEDASSEGVDADDVQASSLSQERYVEMSLAEQVILTISTKGFGKRTSSFEYRITGRGGKGIVAMAVNARNGELVASFPVEDGDGLMLVTNGGQLIRVPVEGIRVAGRGTQGVTVFKLGGKEEVVSVERIPADENESEGDAPEGEDGAPEDEGGEG